MMRPGRASGPGLAGSLRRNVRAVMAEQDSVYAGAMHLGIVRGAAFTRRRSEGRQRRRRLVDLVHPGMAVLGGAFGRCGG